MATISVASDKGGPGKTTTSILIASELALDGYRVALLDTDINQQAASFGAKCDIPGLTVLGEVREDNILAALRKAEAENEIVMIDLPGGSSTLALKAMHRSHFVLAPARAPLPDVRGGIKTIAQINAARERARPSTARAFVWPRALSGFESRGPRHVRQSLEA